ncbi:hypothetical protein BsWGS_25241 [Bradybaena similaris]
MSPILAAFIVFLLTYILVRLLHLTTPASAPLIYAKDRSSQFVQSILTLCPILQQTYVPPTLWGKSGHIQTFVYAKMGRVNIPAPNGIRHTKIMSDGATLTFDLHEPLVPHITGESYCLLFCPGIGNNSESPYVRTLVHHAQNNGYYAAVLNHIGSLKNVPITSPRIFTYGGTEELHTVRTEIERLHPKCGIILVGCSMGANIVVKYLGEHVKHQDGILAAVSINQGYDVNKAKPFLLSWYHLRRAYIYVMTRNQKKMIRRHKEQLFNESIKSQTGISEDAVFAAQTIAELDEAYTRRRHGFQSVEDYYHHNSCFNCLPKVQIPLLVVNAEDDPIVPTPLLECPLQATKTLPNMIFVVTKHGGHLGFYERGFLRPNSLTWMDRLIMEYANAVTRLHQQGSLPKSVHDVSTDHMMCHDDVNDHMMCHDDVNDHKMCHDDDTDEKHTSVAEVKEEGSSISQRSFDTERPSCECVPNGVCE